VRKANIALHAIFTKNSCTTLYWEKDVFPCAFVEWSTANGRSIYENVIHQVDALPRLPPIRMKPLGLFTDHA